jgi:hypothetical protein
VTNLYAAYCYVGGTTGPIGLYTTLGQAQEGCAEYDGGKEPLEWVQSLTNRFKWHAKGRMYRIVAIDTRETLPVARASVAELPKLLGDR